MHTYINLYEFTAYSSPYVGDYNRTPHAHYVMHTQEFNDNIHELYRP